LIEFYEILFVQRGKDHTRQRRLDFVDTFIFSKKFAFKFESCRKSHWFLNVFCRAKF